ncbi:uncharacterized protein [Physcomitrium patens]|uniref:uncharacterized protein isoform X2 n=1 Tax=Physcomitrium patens TaxID=3218 RepID=UPI000D1586E7|nr:uncharacterized protein LOC112292242 isoform X2 [Physcomitrium patens]|eukprot:XP_024396300.1 uncharacterized protein LOC112292242 isoform X2 [Physcomitrella patens]
MPSGGENMLIRVSHIHQTKVHQCKKPVNGSNRVHSIPFESHGGLKDQQRADDMDDTSVEFLQGSGCEAKHSDFILAHEEKSEHDQSVVLDSSKGLEASPDFRNRITRQLRCPAFAWKSLEAMPVRDLFRVTHSISEPKPSKDSDETFVKNGSNLLSTVEGEGIYSEKELVSVVLAFQRWRHVHLKNILGQELRKVLEEAREDETTLSALETELEETEQQLTSARANSSKLRSQLAASMINNHDNSYSAHKTTVSKSEMEMMRIMERLKEADIEIQWRDNEVQQLNERIRCMEDRSGRVDDKLSCLQAEKINLQAENRALLEQFSRDKEVIKQAEEIERLKPSTDRLVEQQKSKHQRLESLVAKYSAEVKTLQEQLQQACEAKCSKEIELATAVKHSSHLKQEKDILLLQLLEAEKRADLASARAEEFCVKLHFTSNDGAKASEEVLSEMIKHLKKLTDHVRELETTVYAADHAEPFSPHADGSSIRPKLVNSIGSKNWCAEAGKCGTSELDQVYCSFPQDTVLGLLHSIYQLCPACTIVNAHDRSHVSFSTDSDHVLLNPSNRVHHSHPQHICQDKINSWIWKWRWAASIARKLHSFDQKLSEESRREHKVQELIERLRTANLTTCVENELSTMVADHKLVPLILSAWRAFARTSVLERKAISRGALLDKMLKALPCWIRRVSKRRQLERSFFRWQVVTLSSDQQPRSQQETRNNSKNKIVEELHPGHEDSKAPSKLLSSPTNRQRLLSESSDKTVVTVQRRPVKTPAAVAHHRVSQKLNLGDNGNQLSSGSQTRVLQALQTTLQQEEVELKKILCHEIQPLQRHVQIQSRPATAPTMSSSAKVREPDEDKVLKSVLGVCNNLALALTNVREKLSPHVLADTENTCSTNQRVKPNKKVSNTGLLLQDSRRARFLDDQTINTSARSGMEPGRPELPKPPPDLEGLGTHTRPRGPTYTCGKKAAYVTSSQQRVTRIASIGDEERTRRLSSTTASSLQKDAFHVSLDSRSTRSSGCAPTMGLQKLNSRNESSFRNGQNDTMTPRTKRARHEIRPAVVNASKKEHRSSIVYSLFPVQENKTFKRVPSCNRKSTRTSNPALNITVIKKILEGGAANASLDEKKLLGSAFTRLLGAKISKLRGGQAM